VTEYARLQKEASAREEVLRLGRLGHELRNQVHVAMLSVEATIAAERTVWVLGSRRDRSNHGRLGVRLFAC